MKTMGWQERLGRPGAIQEVVREATAALVRMDGARLEELAHCCSDLNRGMSGTGVTAEMMARLREAAADVELMGWVLTETKANLAVLYRYRAVRLCRVEAADSASEAFRLSKAWPCEGKESYGDD